MRYVIAASQKQPAECPDCGSDRVVRSRSFFGLVFGWALVMVGFVAAIPTLGVSCIVAIWGVFLMVPKHRCKDCGWKRRTT